MLKRLILGFLALIVLAPLLMWLTWFFTPKTTLAAAIIDKTVLTNDGQKHKFLIWVLNHEKYTKTATKSYRLDEDYFGFFPLKENKFKIKGIERFSSDQLKQLSLDADLVYIPTLMASVITSGILKKASMKNPGCFTAV